MRLSVKDVQQMSFDLVSKMVEDDVNTSLALGDDVYMINIFLDRFILFADDNGLNADRLIRFKRNLSVSKVDDDNPFI